LKKRQGDVQVKEKKRQGRKRRVKKKVRLKKRQEDKQVKEKKRQGERE